MTLFMVVGATAHNHHQQLALLSHGYGSQEMGTIEVPTLLGPAGAAARRGDDDDEDDGGDGPAGPLR